MSEENGDSVRNCEEQTYGFEKEIIRRKKDPRKMAHDYVIFHRGKPE